MIQIKENTNGKKDILILSLILISVIVGGTIGLTILQKKSITNQRICGFLGGLWMRKDADIAHRCYTYQEFYK
jgi:hypothetical protein